MASYGTPEDNRGSSAPPTSAAAGIQDLSAEQLQRLTKDQLAGLLTAFAKTASTTEGEGRSDGSRDQRPHWSLELFTRSAPAPLDFHTWRRGVEERLQAHAAMRDDLKVHYIRGALQGQASHELRRLELRLGQYEIYTPSGLLEQLEYHYIPPGTREQ